MSTLNVGAMAARLGLDPSEFLEKMKGVEGFASASGKRIADDMKKTSREGAESFRLIDEALGIHISRPITKILTNEFPQFAQGLQKLLGAGVVAGVGLAAFEAISTALEKLQKKFEEAKHAQEEYEAASRHLDETLQDLAISHEKRMAQMNAELAALRGDKQGELAGKIKISTIEDAEQAIQQIDKVAEAMERAAKSAEEANTSSHHFWEEFRKQNTSVHNLGIEESGKEFEDFKAKLKETSKEDAAKGTHEGMDQAVKKADELDERLKQMQKHRISDFTGFVDDTVKAFGNVSIRLGFTDKEITQIKSQAAEAHKLVDTLKDAGKEHQKNVELINKRSAAQADPGSKELERLKAETAAQIALAAATANSVAEQKMQTAAGEADQLTSKILEEAHGRLTAAIKKQLEAVHALTAEKQLGKDIVESAAELQKQTQEIQRNISAAQAMSDAYRRGGQAIEDAQIAARLQPEIDKLHQIEQEYAIAKKAADDYAAGGGKGIKGVDFSANLDKLKTAIDAQRNIIEQQRIDLHTEDLAKYQQEIDQTAASIRGEQPYLDALNDSYVLGAEAIRKAQNALALFHWEQAHPGASEDQITAVKAQIDQASIEARRSADARAAAEYSVSTAYQDEINRLERLREVLIQNGQDTLRIDAAIYDAQQQYLRQWDNAAFKIGTFDQKFKAVMNEVVIQGKQASEKMAQAWLQAIDNVSSEMAKLLTGQKTDFKRVVVQLAEQQTKTELEKVEGSVAAHFGIKIPGLEGKPGTSKTNPLYVAVVDAPLSGAKEPPIPGLERNPIRSIGDLFHRGPGAPDGSQSNPFYVLTTQAGPSSSGGIDFSKFSNPFSSSSGEGDSGSPGFLSSFFSRFGGFREKGGDVMPGMDYIVGEKGPELLRIPAMGSIVSNSSLKQVGGSTDNSRTTNVTQHFHGNQDRDSMGRTMRQNLNRILRHIR